MCSLQQFPKLIQACFSHNAISRELVRARQLRCEMPPVAIWHRGLLQQTLFIFRQVPGVIILTHDLSGLSFVRENSKRWHLAHEKMCVWKARARLKKTSQSSLDKLNSDTVDQISLRNFSSVRNASEKCQWRTPSPHQKTCKSGREKAVTQIPGPLLAVGVLRAEGSFLTCSRLDKHNLQCKKRDPFSGGETLMEIRWCWGFDEKCFARQPPF